MATTIKEKIWPKTSYKFQKFQRTNKKGCKNYNLVYIFCSFIFSNFYLFVWWESHTWMHTWGQVFSKNNRMSWIQVIWNRKEKNGGGISIPEEVEKLLQKEKEGWTTPWLFVKAKRNHIACEFVSWKYMIQLCGIPLWYYEYDLLPFVNK